MNETESGNYGRENYRITSFTETKCMQLSINCPVLYILESKVFVFSSSLFSTNESLKQNKTINMVDSTKTMMKRE